MIKVLFYFADGVTERDFDSTFDALSEVVTAFNQCEDYFVGARFANDKEGEWINILKAEEYCVEYERQRKLDELLYAYDPDEPWWNR